MCLRTCALTGVDDEQEEIDPGRACDHRPHEPLVPRDVHDGQTAPVGQVERCVAEVDRDPARLLLRQAVCVLARERANEPRLAMVDVARCPDGHRHRAWISPSSTVST